LLSHKSDALGAYTHFHKYYAAPAGGVKKFRSDNGTEYTNRAFEEFLDTYGTHIQRTCAYTPQQNPVAERANRTIHESANALLIHSGMPTRFWGEAVFTAVHIRNHCPSAATGDTSPIELLTGVKPDISHLRAFGCEVYSYVPRYKRKFQPKATRCVLLGYAEGVKGYRLWDIDAQKIIISRNCRFNETCFPFKDKSENRPPPAAPAAFTESPAKHEKVEPVVEREASVPSVFRSPVPKSAAMMPPERRSVKKRSFVGPPVLIPQPVSASADFEPADSPPDLPRRSQRESRPGGALFDASIGAWVPHSSYADANDVRTCLAEAASSNNGEPATYEEATSCPASEEWNLAIQEELGSHESHGTWELVPKPVGRSCIGSKWVFKLKRGMDGEVTRHKARLCAQGFSQKRGLDYQETFSPVVSFKSFRTLLAIAATEDLDLSQMDVTTAFLYPKLPQTVYMSLPKGVDAPPGMVCKLNYGLYGLKQSSFLWNQELNGFLLSLGFTRCVADPCLYVRRHDGHLLILACYVDDLVIASNDDGQKSWLKQQLSAKYKMKDCGDLEWFLGMRIQRDRANKVITLDQQQYVESVLERFGMQRCNPVSTPASVGVHLTRDMCPTTEEEEEFMRTIPFRSAVGSLMYAMVATRPDIASALGVVCRFMSNPGKQHWTAVKRILCYLRGHTDLKLTFDGKRGLTTYGYSDSDWGGDHDTRRSTTGYVFMLAGAAICWKSKLQKTISLSSTEAEYMSAGSAVQEALSIRNLMEELGFPQLEKTTIHEDNQGAIFLALNQTNTYGTRHIAIRHHFIRHHIQSGEIQLKYCHTKRMVADVLTKALSKEAFRKFRRSMLGNSSFLSEWEY
jgi:hypothetical protein